MTRENKDYRRPITDPDLWQVVENIVFLRDLYGFTQKDLARRSGVCYSYIHMMEAKTMTSSQKCLNKIAERGLNVDKAFLFKYALRFEVINLVNRLYSRKKR